MDTSGKALIEFWDWAGNKGVVNPHTATAKKIACTQVLGVMDNWETLDVKALNVDDVFRRFTNKRAKDFSPGSLSTYKSRFSQALADFLEHGENRESFKPRSQGRSTTRREKTPAAAKDGHRNGKPEPPVNPLPGRAGLVEYPFPLREGRFAYLRLPVNLKMADVKRLTAYLNTLVDEQGIA